MRQPMQENQGSPTSTRRLWRAGGLFFLLLIQACQSPPPPAGPIHNAALEEGTPKGYTEPGEVPLFEAYRRVERENWQKPQLVISRLGDLHDKTIVDIGAGTGFFTLRLAEKAQRVIATDIDQRLLDYITTSLREGRRQGYMQVETRLTQPTDPGIQPAEADIVFIVNTYHLIENRQEYFTKVHSGLKPNGTIFIVDYKKQELPVGPAPAEKVDVQQVFEELKQAGFDSLQADTTTLDFQYIITGH